MTDASEVDNAIPIEAWNTILFEKFCRFRWQLIHGLSGHSDELFRRCPYPPGVTVLDVGCGFGDTAQQIARQVGPGGSVVGVDCSRNFIDIATDEAKQGKVDNVSFLVADVQTDDLGGPYDYVFSRFGTMFFNMPVPALRNMRRALVPGGELTMIVWRRREDNAWIHDAEERVKEIVPVVSHEDTDEVHCGPGPFSMAGADMVSDMLRIAGFDDIRFQRYDSDICVGQTLQDAVEFAMALGPAGEIIRLAGEEGEKRKAQVITALQELMSRYERPDGIWAGSSTWIITAKNPAASRN